MESFRGKRRMRSFVGCHWVFTSSTLPSPSLPSPPSPFFEPIHGDAERTKRAFSLLFRLRQRKEGDQNTTICILTRKWGFQSFSPSYQSTDSAPSSGSNETALGPYSHASVGMQHPQGGTEIRRQVLTLTAIAIPPKLFTPIVHTHPPSNVNAHFFFMQCRTHTREIDNLFVTFSIIMLCK